MNTTIVKLAVAAVLNFTLAAYGAGATRDAEESGDPSPPASEFFRPTSDVARQYVVDRIYPKGRIFPFSYYSVGGSSGKKVGSPLRDDEIQQTLKRVEQDGATMIGPQYELNGRILKDAEQHGLGAIYTIGDGGMLKHKEGTRDTRVLAPEDQVREAIRQQVEAVMDNPHIAWWYVTPEELRYWRRDENRYLEIAAETIRKTDPRKRPVWMYDPGHRDAGGLAHTVRHLDICGKGMYTNYSGAREARIWVRWTIDQEREAVRQANPHAIPIAVPEMFQQPPKELLGMIPRWVRHDVYLSLIAGAKGIVVFSLRQRPNFDAHEDYYRAYAAVSRELNGPLKLGQVFLFGEQRNDVRVALKAGPEQAVLGENKYPSVSFSDIAYGNHRYLFLANSANETVRVRVDGLPKSGIRAEALFPGQKEPDVQEGGFALELVPLAVKVFRFERNEQ